MEITSTLSGTHAAAALVLFISFVIPTPACADIYKWTDAEGRTFFSSAAPTPADKAKNVQLLVKENAHSATAPAQGHAATPTEQALLGRIESLERQLGTRSYPAPMSPPATPYGTYYAPPPPPASAGYYADRYDYSSYYPGYYHPVPLYASSIYYPARAIVRRPLFANGGSFHHGGSLNRGGSFHRGGGRGGRR